MFAWLVSHTILYVIVFFWGYFTVKFLFGGFWWFFVGVILVSGYYDFSNHTGGFLVDIFYILGGLDNKFYIREKAGEYFGYGVRIGWAGIQEEFAEQVQAIRQKLNLDRYLDNDSQQSNQYNGFDQTWYDDQLHKAQQETNRAREQAKRAEENAKKAREEADSAKRNNRQSSNGSNHSNQSNDKRLDPTKLKDAYEILGVEYGADKATCKKNFKRLMALYHPDKMASFTGSRRAKMEQEAKDIGVAWETVQKRG